MGRRGRGPELSPPRPDGPEGQDRPRRPREFAAVCRHCCHALLKEAGWHECFLPCSHPPLFFAGRQPLDLPRPAAPPDGARFCGIALLINRDKQVRPRMTRHFAMPRSHAGSVLARASCPRRARGILVRITFFACPSRSSQQLLAPPPLHVAKRAGARILAERWLQTDYVGGVKVALFAYIHGCCSAACPIFKGILVLSAYLPGSHWFSGQEGTKVVPLPGCIRLGPRHSRGVKTWRS